MKLNNFVSSPLCLSKAFARSMRSGPKGETQLTPMPIDKRGFGELPRKRSWKPGDAVNKVGSFVYGTILAIFLLAFYTKKVGGKATVIGALIGEAAVVWCAVFTNLAWLWWNVIGCGVGVGAALMIQIMLPRQNSDEIVLAKVG